MPGCKAHPRNLRVLRKDFAARIFLIMYENRRESSWIFQGLESVHCCTRRVKAVSPRLHGVLFCVENCSCCEMSQLIQATMRSSYRAGWDDSRKMCNHIHVWRPFLNRYWARRRATPNQIRVMWMPIFFIVAMDSWSSDRVRNRGRPEHETPRNVL
jgi:hypothetical protein